MREQGMLLETTVESNTKLLLSYTGCGRKISLIRATYKYQIRSNIKKYVFYSRTIAHVIKTFYFNYFFFFFKKRHCSSGGPRFRYANRAFPGSCPRPLTVRTGWQRLPRLFTSFGVSKVQLLRWPRRAIKTARAQTWRTQRHHAKRQYARERRVVRAVATGATKGALGSAELPISNSALTVLIQHPRSLKTENNLKSFSALLSGLFF